MIISHCEKRIFFIGRITVFNISISVKLYFDQMNITKLISFDLKYVLRIEIFLTFYNSYVSKLIQCFLCIGTSGYQCQVCFFYGALPGILLTSKGRTCFILLICTQLLNISVAINCATFKVIRIKSFFPFEFTPPLNQHWYRPMFNACNVLH